MKAKFLWKRTPKSFKADSQSELQRIWSLAQFLIQRKYNQAFEFVNQLKKVNYTWSDPEIEVLFERLIEISKEKLFDLLNFAYSTINVQELATILSISNEEAIGVAIGRNWTLDESKLFLLPKKKRKNPFFLLFLFFFKLNFYSQIIYPTEKIEIAEIPNQLQMQQLTNLVSFLET